MFTYEGLRLKILKIPRKSKVFVKQRKNKLKISDFTIISNNCWGGMIYESYDLPKQSPTIGCFFMAKDYLKLLSDLHGFLASSLDFIEPKDSKWKNDPLFADKSSIKYPIGVLSNGKDRIEIFFIHYHSKKEAKDKWERRCKRINWDKILVKFNDQNGCTEEEIKQFIDLNFKYKLFFTCKSWNIDIKGKLGKGFCIIKQFPKHNTIMASYEPFGKNRYINITEFINRIC